MGRYSQTSTSCQISTQSDFKQVHKSQIVWFLAVYTSSVRQAISSVNSAFKQCNWVRLFLPILEKIIDKTRKCLPPRYSQKLESWQDWQVLFQHDLDPSKMAFHTCRILTKIIDKYIPIKQISELKFYCKPWITSAIKASIHMKNALYKIFLKTKSS